MAEFVEWFEGPPRVEKRNRSICSLTEWREHGRPAGGDSQWRDGRSAKETARAWLGLLPVLTLLESHRATSGLRISRVEPEVRLKFDDYGGNTRNSDVVVYGQGDAGKVVIAIEAKADEPFDRRSLAEAARSSTSERSNLPARADELSRRLFGSDLAELDENQRDVPYQLAHGPIAAALEAERVGASTAVFAVHEFRTDETDDALMKENNRAWAQAMLLLSDGDPTVGVLSELRLADPPEGVTLLIGKARSDLRDGGREMDGGTL
jgi:hypothetical protein